MSSRIPASSRVRTRKGEPTSAAAGTRDDRRHAAPSAHTRARDNPRRALSIVNTNRIPVAVARDESSRSKKTLPDLVKCTSTAVSAAELDVDARDAGNPACCVDYVAEIHANLRVQERLSCYALRPAFLNHLAGAVKASHRVLLVEWLVLVAQRLSSVPETLYLTVDILDRYLQAARAVSRGKLQLVGVTAFFIASKYEEIVAPSVRDMVRLSADAYTAREILERERTVLQTLDYRLGKPTPITFLRRYSKAATTNVKSHQLAKYILELTLLSASLSAVPPSRRAAAALLLSRSILCPAHWTTAQLWPAAIAHHSGYSAGDLQPTKTQLQLALRRAHSPEGGSGGEHADSVREKYASSAFLSVSEMVQLLIETKPHRRGISV